MKSTIQQLNDRFGIRPVNPTPISVLLEVTIDALDKVINDFNATLVPPFIDQEPQKKEIAVLMAATDRAAADLENIHPTHHQHLLKTVALSREEREEKGMAFFYGDYYVATIHFRHHMPTIIAYMKTFLVSNEPEAIRIRSTNEELASLFESLGDDDKVITLCDIIDWQRFRGDEKEGYILLVDVVLPKKEERNRILGLCLTQNNKQKSVAPTNSSVDNVYEFYKSRGTGIPMII